MTRRAFVGIATGVLFVPGSRTYKLRAIAAAHMPHTRTIRSADPRVAKHFAQGGVFEIREYVDGPRLLLFDSLEARWRSQPSPGPKTNSISLYRPA
jgi:hypothetical protein